MLLRCLSDQEAEKVIQETHNGICGAHQPRTSISRQNPSGDWLTIGYWPSMIKDCMDYARRCDARQFHGDYIHPAPEPLHPTVPSWSFEAWEMDVIGSNQTSLYPLRCATSRCLPSFVASLSSALPRTDLPPLLLLPSLTALERNKLN